MRLFRVREYSYNSACLKTAEKKTYEQRALGNLCLRISNAKVKNKEISRKRTKYLKNIQRSCVCLHLPVVKFFWLLPTCSGRSAPPTMESCSLPTTMTCRDFWAAIDVWIKKPHVVNRRLWGTSLLCNFQTSCDVLWDPYQHYSSLNLEGLTEDNLKNEEKCVKLIVENMKLNPPKHDENNIEIAIIKLLPKLPMEASVYQFVAKKYLDDEVFFANITSKQHNNLGPSYPYSFYYSDNKILLKALKGSKENLDEKSFKWLEDSVLPQIVKWGEETSVQESKHQVCSGSLNLVSHEPYYHKYNQLKLKYGKEMVEMWTESTDPSKYVYEDIAIASYLLVLWESERERLRTERRQTFVDLGCGNGLLVFILSAEGHSGFGIDVKRRHIWDAYPKHVVLKEQTISPSDAHLFPDIDWILGNHSDELTPWVPVIAARSSYKCNFWVLPCCSYNFNGSKYQRKNTSKSQYTEYLEYVQRLSERCGFKTSVDRLKIPSTKRICIIGTDRSYAEDKLVDACKIIQGFIEEGQRGGEWISDFKAREATERVRNCTQVDKSVVNSIVAIISNRLMKDCNGEVWCAGSPVELNEIAKLVPENLLKSLKSECGGLQTLLRNNHQIFKIESGKVQLRYPQTVNEVEQIQKYKRKLKFNKFSVKKKPCWFYSHHPQGCPLSDADCSFVHELVT